jgi:hypothetical protein
MKGALAAWKRSVAIPWEIAGDIKRNMLTAFNKIDELNELFRT